VAEQHARVQPRAAELTDVRITRACSRCGHSREAGLPCAGCGNPEPPVVHELGTQSASYRNPFRQAWWRTAGSLLARRRAARANRGAGRIS
jgi:hypothetical protein